MTAEIILKKIVDFRWPVLLVGLMAFAGMAINAPSLEKDTSANAFIDPEDPALVARDRTREIFGLSAPIVVAVQNSGDNGIYNKGTLKTVGWISDQISKLDNVDPARVTSLATESNIEGTDEGMEVEDFYDQVPDTQERIDWLRGAINTFPLYRGSLVSRDGTMTLIVAELVDEEAATKTYDNVLNMLENAPLSEGDELHVAGEGAVTGYLSTYIDNDARKLNPMAGLIITIILLLGFRALRAALLPNLVVLLTVGSTIGTMAAVGVDFYVITNGLIVTMIGIAVADSVHIFSQYYEEIAADPKATGKQVTVRALTKIWRPITLTTFTTMAGFTGLAVTATMPPIHLFGVFGAYAVFMAWLFSLTVLPAILSMLKPRPSKLFTRSHAGSDDRVVGRFAKWVLNKPVSVAGAGLVVALVAGVGASMVQVNEERIANFKPSEDIYIADKTINRAMDGTYYLDVKIEADSIEGLYEPVALRKMEALQDYAETVAGVGGATSVVDYIKQMHKAVNENRDEFYTIPDDPILIAQLFFLYFTSGDPADFENKIDGERKLALLRISLKSSLFKENERIVNTLQHYIDDAFQDEGLKATLTGRINIDYHWIKGIAETNLLSVIVSLAAVTLMAALLFRSPVAALFAFIPVGLSVLLVYAVMGFNGIWLGLGTSMFASIAIGIGVDFSIHTLDRMRDLISQGKGRWRDRMVALYPTTGRALMYNFAAVALGFGVLMTSDVPPLINFGMLVAIAVSTAFLASLLILPALATLLKPKFLERNIDHV